MTVPAQARVVVIGGGVIGCSVAYHLAHMGWTDVVLLERDRLTSGTTWHAAGLIVTFGSTSETSTEMRKYTRDLYARLEAETGQSTGLRQCGFIEVAADLDRLEEYRRIAAFNRYCGVDVHEISPGQVKELFPLAEVDDVLAGFYVPGDGRADPVGVTMALARGARQRGVAIVEGMPCTGVIRRRGAVTGVTTPAGDIACEYVVNCAGMWARQLGAQAGVAIPLQAAEHYYLITERIPEVAARGASWPVLEDPASYGYFREEVGGLMIGLFEPVCAPWNIRGVPDDFSFGEIQPDWDRMAGYIETAMRRVPIAMTTGVRKLFCGPESFTPDLLPCIGEAPELRNYFVAAGLNSIGILTGGGLGRVVAHWIVTGRPDVDVTGFHIDRLHAYQTNPEYRRTRTVESLGMVYKCHYPTYVMQTARGARRSPIHDRLAARNAFFRDVSGWEGADWYAPPGVEPASEPTWGRPSWFPYWAAEHRAARDGVIVMDMSFMSKFQVEGHDAGRVLEWISANRVDGPSGVITYTQWLDEAGKLQADLTVAKLDDERFWVVASDTAHRHALAHLARHIGDRHAFVADLTSAYGQLNLQGPRSRELLQVLTSADVSDAALPYRGVRDIDIGFARVRCIRITYLGELGYELYIPAEQTAHVYDRIVAAGERFGLVHAGLKALASLRMEKAYRDYGHDIDNTDTVLEAGLGFAVDLGKPGGFLGKEAVAAQKASGPLARRLVQVLVGDPEPLLFHAEVVRCGDRPCGYLRAASYGHTLGGAVGLAMIEARAMHGEPGRAIDQKAIDAARWDVEIAGRRYPATVSLRPLFDPDNRRIK
ncbi:MAG: FAD-dependent oxidoreductase [Deltaproteobacteria bacterium]|nr:MAG: FAD-dependent oxidoreductase [Deltaproteobacteria bacterium]